jgi:Beta-lactamase class C and other penicillin binding proteins
MIYNNSIKKIEEYITSGVFPGVSLAFINKGKIDEFYLGQKQIKPYKSPTEPGLTYDLASVSKVVGVGTLLIRDILAGKLDLDSPLQKYYPAFHNDDLSLGEFLTHTTGVDPYIPNRDQLNAKELTEAMNNIKITADKSFKYTDVNFLLLGFMVENLYKDDLASILKREVFDKFGLENTQYGPVDCAVKTSKDVPEGVVHDPKARLLGRHAGSAGIFSTLKDLEIFVEKYLDDEFDKTYFSGKIKNLDESYSKQDKKRSLAWDLLDDGWLLHTGYTGTFIMINLREKQGLVFLSNRVHLKDERAKWIAERDELIKIIINDFKNS